MRFLGVVTFPFTNLWANVANEPGANIHARGLSLPWAPGYTHATDGNQRTIRWCGESGTSALHTVAPCHNAKFLVTQRH